MAVAIELDATPRPGILELAQHAHIADSVLRGLHDEQRAFKRREARTNPYLRALEEETRDKKSNYLLEILRQRKSILEANPNYSLPVEVTFVRFPGEEFTEVSQNPVFFSFPNSHPAIPDMTSALDLLARSAGSTDARVALDLMGDPDAVEDESVGRFVKRTHEEIRVSERRFRVAREIGDHPEMARLDEIRDSLVERLLNLRGGKKIYFLIKCFELLNNESSKIAIMTGRDNLTIVPQTPKLRELILKSGGWDRVIDTSQMEHSDLLSELS